MSENSHSSAGSGRGPNGFPYLDSDRTQIGQWENGEFRMRVAREDGELMNLNLRPEQFDALVEAVRDIEDRSVDTGTVQGGGPE